MKMHDPPHPGEVLRSLCLEPLGLTITEAAKALGVSRKTLSSIPERASRNQSGDGDSSIAGLRYQRRELAESTAAIRPVARRTESQKAASCEIVSGVATAVNGRHPSAPEEEGRGGRGHRARSSDVVRVLLEDTVSQRLVPHVVALGF